MSSKKNVIVGYDAVSALGTDLATQWDRAARGESGVGRLTRFPLARDFPVQISGEVAEIDTTPYAFLSPRSLALWPSPIFKYAMLVVHRALANSGIEITPELSPRVAVTFSSAIGGQDAILAADRRMIAEGKMPPPYANPNSCINMVGGKISILTGATGPITATITACATGVTSMIIGAMLLDAGRADVAICGAVDFALVEPIVAGFATMNGAYQARPGRIEQPATQGQPPLLHGPKGVCHFRRRGLRHPDDPGLRALPTGSPGRRDRRVEHDVGRPPFCRAALENGGRAAWPTVLTTRGYRPQDVACRQRPRGIHQDRRRRGVRGAERVFGDRIPPVAANKSMIGHAMGAASAIESILAIEGMQGDPILPTINYAPNPELLSRLRPRRGPPDSSRSSC